MTASNVLPISIVYRKGAFLVTQRSYRSLATDPRCEYELIGNTPRRAFVVDGARASTLRFPSSQELVYWLGECEGKGFRLEPALNLQNFGVTAVEA